jgi:uroporphyrinogen-III decarboxylase
MANKKKLLEWIKNGDTDKVPILFGSHKDIVASYLKVRPDELTGRQMEEEAVKMGIEAVNSLGCITLFDAVPFCEDIKIKEKEETLLNGTVRTFRTISTPKGILSDVREKPLTWESAPKECMVKSEADMPAFEYFVRSTVKAAIEEPGYKKELIKKGMEKKKEMSEDTISVWGTWTPAFELMCTNYFMSDTALYMLYDYTSLFEDLMELVWEKDRKTLLPVGLELGADLFMTAINGLEWFSPSIYEKYLIPQGRRLFDWSSENNNLSWLHTCGKMNVLINSGAYDTLRPNILESLSSPPPGDIRDLRTARERLGHGITTKGCLNVEVIYNGTADEVKKEVNRILDCTKGYKHILGDTNSHFYGDPPENIKAVIDTVAERGQSFV